MITALFLTIAAAAIANALWLAFGRTVKVISQRIVKATKGRKVSITFAS